ncbi:MAG: response regulator [Anaerolineae bacterium]|nr:response regulator [Anaerolineae bacterium]
MPKILVVEDNNDLAQLYKRAFHQFEVEVVGTAWDAIAHLEKSSYQLVVLDMHLPEVPGMIVLQHIRKMPQGDSVNVFVVSADDSLKVRAERAGIQFWMTKPVDLDELVEAAQPYLSSEH